MSEVGALAREDVKFAPELSSVVDANVITGIGAVKIDGVEKMLILMDNKALLRSAVGVGD